MKIQIENLKAQITGKKLNIYQKADALIEFNKLLDYVDELEQLTIPVVTQRSELCEGNCGMNYCDENGCVDNKPDVGEPKPPEHCG